MRIKSIKYVESEGTAQEWRLDGFTLGKINLVVGKNASGKSRALNIIHALSLNLIGQRPPSGSSSYDVEFTENDQLVNYTVKWVDGNVVEERFLIGERVLLDRSAGGGKGTIWAEQIGNNILFQTPVNQFAVVARRDLIQHPFLEGLHSWGESVRLYCFGSSLGRDHLALIQDKDVIHPNERDPFGNNIVVLYRLAIKEFGEEFNQALIEDMKHLDYDLSTIGLISPVTLRGMPGLVGLYVQEKDLPGITDQVNMSQGMFRALSLLTQITYAQMSHKCTTIIIDDIGEGLDFDRSCLLIELLRDKAKSCDIQVILSTNDRFVMNHIPLDEWSVIKRSGNYVMVLNNLNSKDLFNEFKLTGLSNFSFLEMDFANGVPADEGDANE